MSVDLVIDIGSKFVTIAQRGRGVVLKEPALVLLESRRNKMRLVEAGRGATKYLHQAASNEQVIAPMRGGMIVHEFAAQEMLREFLQRVVPAKVLRPSVRMIACVSCGLTNTEKSQIEKVLIGAGCNEVTIVESPIAVAASVSEGSSQFVLDIGASKTEVAIVGHNGIVAGCSVNIGGDAFNNALIDYVTDTKRCRMTMPIAERVKKSIGSMYENDTTCTNVEMEEIGTDIDYTYKIYAKDFKNAIEPLVAKIIEVAYNLTFQIPDTMAQDILLGGIVVCGGSSYIPGLCDYIGKALALRAKQIDEPLNAAVLGALYYCDHPERLEDVLNVQMA